MKYTTIFFDLDDTLIDTALNSKQVLEEVYTDYTIDKYYPSFNDFYQKYQSINLHLWDQYEQNLISKEELKTGRFKQALNDFTSISTEQSLEMNNDFMGRVSNKKNIIEGVEDILEYLQPKYHLYIISNGFLEVQDKKIKNAGLDSYFKDVFLSDHVGKNKPHPMIFNYALKESSTSSTDCIMIGDNINTDIIGAKNIGIDQIWFNPKSMVDSSNVAPTYTVKTLNDIKTIL
ncbi:MULTISPECIES: YjjG family noncanonical pyrimidine nucleotidase [unclassified Dysgonomonas]|uniref:YjjG family noncanonical pyrimidine nucleotidase n=1 Tax=unclassified Dysgonomonas TaxID=2630389 RepID=UPI000681CF81|nr:MULTISPECIES: YjjG family noncanonical pyrimidine nucleotidase [unclassified Dysgonomonas]MBD8347455.1 noncanonical pyrimidine nucleotidase, YjjG family [Dysgonomonas sp. HGC4]MBF0577086.1 noncanonical pyrimidine nucleotidase, YjjG family [Dysgonomonas sp. GY617]